MMVVQQIDLTPSLSMVIYYSVFNPCVAVTISILATNIT